MTKYEKNENTVFEDGVYTVWSNSDVKIGDEVELTTSELDFDCVEGIFEPTLRCFTIEAKIVEEDLSSYIPEHSCNGGAYGYATAKVLEVEEVVE